MGHLTVLALRIVIAIALAGSLVVQAVMMPLLWTDLDDAPAWFRVSFVVTVVLGVLTLQVVAVCIWQLLTMVRRDTVFSPAAFRYVDVIIGAVLAGAVLMFAVAVILAPSDVAPGLVGLVCGLALVIGGVALVIVVMRTLLAQAVATRTEARKLRSELDEVI